MVKKKKDTFDFHAHSPQVQIQALPRKGHCKHGPWKRVHDIRSLEISNQNTGLYGVVNTHHVEVAVID